MIFSADWSQMMKRQKVLLVDDVQLLLELEKAFLKSLPVDILTARNGVEAIVVAHREQPDLIYLDLNMPVMDGQTCCTALKTDPATRKIPVIMVTTAGNAEDELVCRNSGCDDFITKPINKNEFLDKGRKCLLDFERRRKRFSYSGSIEYLKNGEAITGSITDISTGGLFIAAGQDSMPDDPVDFAFTLPHPEQAIIVAARGRVTWTNSSADPSKSTYPPGFGVEFTDIDPKVVTLIEKYFFYLSQENGKPTEP